MVGLMVGKEEGGSDASRQRRVRHQGVENVGRGGLRTAASNNPTTKSPTKIVCTRAALAANKHNSVELGALLSLGIVAVFLYGFFCSMVYFPPIYSGRLVGSNLNLPVLQRDLDLYSELHAHSQGKLEVEHVRVPHATWPTSIRNEVGNTEIVTHPGNKDIQMTVPKFWSQPLHNQHPLAEPQEDQRYTREQAMRVGTCAQPDPVTGLYVRGDSCPLAERTIFVAIASYRDYQCRETVESIFGRASNPSRIRVGVVDQIVDGEDAVCNVPQQPCNTHPEQALCKYADQVDSYKMEAQLSVGPVFARHLGHRLYRGEYYATQSDAHVTFTQNWDLDIVEQFESTHNEMAVLSTYLTDIVGSIDKYGRSLRFTRPIMCNTQYETSQQGKYLRHESQPEGMPAIHGMPQLQPWWAAGYSFSRGHFVVNVPYDMYQPMIFQGEEMSIGIRGFTVGYDYYAPERSVCFHHYANGQNKAKRDTVKHFWENGKRYPGVGKRAMHRLLGIVRMSPETPPEAWDHSEEAFYGIGSARTPEQFYKVFGIDVVHKTTQHLCQFVDAGGGRMHRQFVPFLRDDGMGIDYGKIDFQYKDP